MTKGHDNNNGGNDDLANPNENNNSKGSLKSSDETTTRGQGKNVNTTTELQSSSIAIEAESNNNPTEVAVRPEMNTISQMGNPESESGLPGEPITVGTTEVAANSSKQLRRHSHHRQHHHHCHKQDIKQPGNATNNHCHHHHHAQNQDLNNQNHQQHHHHHHHHCLGHRKVYIKPDPSERIGPREASTNLEQSQQQKPSTGAAEQGAAAAGRESTLGLEAPPPFDGVRSRHKTIEHQSQLTLVDHLHADSAKESGNNHDKSSSGVKSRGEPKVVTVVDESQLQRRFVDSLSNSKRLAASSTSGSGGSSSPRPPRQRRSPTKKAPMLTISINKDDNNNSNEQKQQHTSLMTTKNATSNKSTMVVAAPGNSTRTESHSRRHSRSESHSHSSSSTNGSLTNANNNVQLKPLPGFRGKRTSPPARSIIIPANVIQSLKSRQQKTTDSQPTSESISEKTNDSRNNNINVDSQSSGPNVNQASSSSAPRATSDASVVGSSRSAKSCVSSEVVGKIYPIKWGAQSGSGSSTSRPRVPDVASGIPPTSGISLEQIELGSQLKSDEVQLLYSSPDNHLNRELRDEQAKLVAPGTKQSPIALMTLNPTYRNLNKPLIVDYHGSVENLRLNNTGYFWDVKIPYQVSMMTSLHGAQFQSTSRYRLDQFHCHWGQDDQRGSEHTVDGLHYSAEVHFVHYNMDKYRTLAQAARHSDGLVVLAVFLKARDDNHDHAELEKIAANLHAIMHPGQHTIIRQGIRIENLLPQNRSFWSYHGSLTTSPHYECVTWFVMKYPIQCSSSQLQRFRSMKSSARNDENTQILNNFRDIQPLYGRVIYNFDEPYRCHH